MADIKPQRKSIYNKNCIIPRHDRVADLPVKESILLYETIMEDVKKNNEHCVNKVSMKH